MHEEFVSRTSLLAMTLWVVVVLLLAMAWLVAIQRPDWWLWAGMLAATGLAVSAVAATAHMRIYAVRMCSLIRATSGLECPPDGTDRDRELHSIR